MRSEPLSPEEIPKARVVRRNVRIAGRRTTIKLEHAMWQALIEICAINDKTINQICTEVARSEHAQTNFTSELRLYILAHYQTRARDAEAALARIEATSPIQASVRSVGG